MADHVWDGRAEIGLADLSTGRDDLVVEHFLNQELVLVLPPGTKPVPTPINELGNLEFITTGPGTSTRRHLDEALLRSGASPRIAVETDQREAIVPLVLAGAGVELLPNAMGRSAAANGGVVSPIVPTLKRSISIVHRRGTMSAAAARFRDLAVQVGIERHE